MSRTHVTFLVDRSGSMSTQQQGVKDGFKKFLTEQKAVPGECTMTVIQFDDTDPCEVIIDNCSIRDIADTAMNSFEPRGMTPLYDATARAITVTERALAKVPAMSATPSLDPIDTLLAASAPDHVIFVVFTDGVENASREFDFTRLTELVKKKESEGWTFVYLGANHDAYAQAATMGASAGNTRAYAGSDVGYAAAAASVSSSITAVRSGLKGVSGQSMQNFFEDDEDDHT